MSELSINVLQTGSSGNCLILENIIALDMGVTYKTVAPCVRSLQLVFVGHEHGDHFKDSTIRALARNRPSLRFCGGPWMIPRFIAAGVSAKNIDVLEAGKIYDYGAFQIEPVTLFHNVPNFGLKIYMNGKKAIYIVDTGSVSGIEAKDFDYFLLEANHTEADILRRMEGKIAEGSYSYELAAMKNHLSREQAEAWLARNKGPESQVVFLHQHVERKRGSGHKET